MAKKTPSGSPTSASTATASAKTDSEGPDQLAAQVIAATELLAYGTYRSYSQAVFGQGVGSGSAKTWDAYRSTYAGGRNARPKLTDRLRALDDNDLADVIALLPSLSYRPPSSLEDLATTLGGRMAAGAGTAFLDYFAYTLIELLSIFPEGATIDPLVPLLPDELPTVAIEAAIGRLEAAFLLTRGPDGGLWLAGGVRDTFSFPCDLGPPLKPLLEKQTRPHLDEIARNIGVPFDATSKVDAVDRLTRALSTPSVLASILKTAPPAVAGFVDELARLGPLTTISTRDWLHNRHGTQHSQWLLERGLVQPIDWGRAVLPLEVGLTLRGGKPLAHRSAFKVLPPLEATPRHPPLEATAGAINAATLVQTLARMIEDFSVTPPAELKDTGLGARALKQITAACDVDAPTAALLVELAYVSGLLARVEQAPDADSKKPSRGRGRYAAPPRMATTLAPSAAYGAWCRFDLPERWAHVVRAWLGSRRWVSVAGQRDFDNKLVPAAEHRPLDANAHVLRRSILEQLDALPAGHVPSEDDALGHLLFDAPFLWERAPGDPDFLRSRALAESDLLGVTTGGALTDLGRALLAESRPPRKGSVLHGRWQDRRRAGARGALPSALVAVATDRLPKSEQTFTVQGDLTIMAPATLAPSISSELLLLADVESQGAATMYRVGESSIGRALDRGRSAEAMIAFLETHATKGVPQSLSYLINDVARRHGQLRARSVASYLRCDDPGLLADAVHARKTAKLNLRLVAPTVAVSTEPAKKLLEGLRAAGFLPAAEDADGVMLTATSMLNHARHDDDQASGPADDADRSALIGIGSGAVGSLRSAMVDQGPPEPDRDHLLELARHVRDGTPRPERTHQQQMADLQGQLMMQTERGAESLNRSMDDETGIDYAIELTREAFGDEVQVDRFGNRFGDEISDDPWPPGDDGWEYR